MQPSLSRNRFEPAQLKARHDGWSPARQLRFIEELAATKSIARACRAVGMSRVSAYKLRDHPEAAQFRAAWRKALEPDFAAERRRSHARCNGFAGWKSAAKFTKRMKRTNPRIRSLPPRRLRQL